MKTKINLAKKTSFFSYFQKLGSTLIYPISILPLAGIILGFGVLINIAPLSNFLIGISQVLFFIFPILVYLSYVLFFNNNNNNNNNGQSLIVAIVFLLIYISIQTLFANIEFIPDVFITQLTNMNVINSNDSIGIYVFGFSVFFGILLGATFVYLYKRLDLYLILLSSIMVSIIFIPLLMIVDTILYSLGYLISLLPFGLNAFFYGFFNRLLLPIGLHSILIPTFLYSSVGGVLTLTADGQETITIVGDSLIWQFMYINNIPFDQLQGDVIIDGINYSYQVKNSSDIGQYQQGFLPIMIFCFPMAGLAIVNKIGWKDGKKYFVASFIPLLSGITEPFEFLFIFISPMLYLIHAFLTGLSFMLMSIAHVSIWLSSGWALDLLFFGIIPGAMGYATNWYWILLIGPSLSIFYYASFYFLFPNNLNKSNI